MSLLTYFKKNEDPEETEKQTRKRKLDFDDCDAIDPPPSKRLRVAKKSDKSDKSEKSENSEEKNDTAKRDATAVEEKELSPAAYVSDDDSPPPTEEAKPSVSTSTSTSAKKKTEDEIDEQNAEDVDAKEESAGEEEEEEQDPLTYETCHESMDASWKTQLKNEFQKTYFKELQRNLKKEEASGAEIFPPVHQVYRAFELCPWDKLKVVIVGQDPYHDNGQAEGLCFSVAIGMKIPSSLRNMYKEATSDFGFKPPGHGSLVYWGEQGVLLLNTALTVRAHKANSHAKWGWQQLTDAVIKVISRKHDGVVFILWGKQAQKKGIMIDKKKHRIVQSAHPSGLSASRGFYGSKPYSKSNALLEKLGKEPIDWQIPPQ